VAGVDPVLTKDGIISPGLGDTVSCSSAEAIIAITTHDFYREIAFSTQYGHEEKLKISVQVCMYYYYNRYESYLALRYQPSVKGNPRWSKANAKPWSNFAMVT
jgi:hypothetical protein